MIKIKSLAVVLFSLIVTTALPTPAAMTFTGIVQRVWEDGFQLKSGNRVIIVDSWDIYGDNTSRWVRSGEQVTVTGEYEDGEFDAFSIRK